MNPGHLRRSPGSCVCSDTTERVPRNSDSHSEKRFIVNRQMQLLVCGAFTSRGTSVSPAFPSFNRSSEPFAVLLSSEEIQERISELGAEIARDAANFGEELVLVCVLKGLVLFLADLARHIPLPLTLDFIGISSYGDETRSSGVVQITADLSKPIEGKHVIIVEDIIDTGLTAHYLLDNLKTRKPASLKLCSLLHKPARQKVDVHIDYLGFTVPDKFVVGYGLDIAQQWRNLPFIGYVEGA